MKRLRGGAHRILSKLLVLGTAVGFCSCDGEVPPYSDPSALFSASLKSSYVLTDSQNSLLVSLSVRHFFDETLQDQLSTLGEIKIILVRDTSIHKTFPVTVADLIYAKDYNSSTRILTLDPGDSLKFLFTWSFVDDSGKSLPDSTFRYFLDETCVPAIGRRIAVPEVFEIQASVRIFDKTGTVQADPIYLRMCHVNIWVGPRACPPIFGCPE